MVQRIGSSIALFVLFCCIAVAQDNVPYTRDEVASVKKKLVTALEAVGQLPAGYAKERENFNLPTEANKNRESGLFYPVYAGAERTFGSEKAAEKSEKELQKEYEKKIAEAQAKGDYMAISKIAQEMQQKMGQANLKKIEGKKTPIDIHVQLNSSSGTAIDPDAVLFEKPGVIALKEKNDGADEKGRVMVYFDPVSLKDTKQLSKVEMKMPEKGTSSKMAIFNITIEFNGPTADIESWAKRIETGKVLSQIDRR